MQNPTRGRVYRRCACRDDAGDQLGPHCPKLTNRSHGRWSYAVDLAPVDGKRQTVGDYLTEWMRTKALTLKPTTIANYQRYISQDLLPSLGHLRLDTLNHRHVMRFVHEQLDGGRGLTTIRRCAATLSSALHDAVRQRRLPHNAARYVTNLFEVIIGTGMRRGEALALHWADVHLDERLLYVRYTLSNINNTTPVFTTPKTRSSQAWIRPVRPGHRCPCRTCGSTT
jgi:integrase